LELKYGKLFFSFAFYFNLRHYMEAEKDDEELRKMQEALKNGFRRPTKNGGLGGDGPDYFQRRKKVKDGEESEEEDDGWGPVNILATTSVLCLTLVS